MEIILKDLKVKSVKSDKKINNVNYVFKDNSINFCYGLSGELIKDLLYGKKDIINGYIYVNEKGSFLDIGYIGNFDKILKGKCFLDDLNYINDEYELKTKDIIKKGIDSLKLVGLEEVFLNKNYNEMSTGEYKLIEFSYILFINPKVIILDYFFKGLVYRDIENIKKILKKLKTKYKKNIIIINDKIDIFLDIVDNYVIFDKGKIATMGDKNDLYNDKIYKYIDCPKIINFVKLARENNIALLDYIDIKELIKAIYRDVEAK
jgi:energy-coupling factor transporter ATP-binding protein EcfA2